MSAYTMTANNYGVYSCTIKDLKPGTHEYKLVVNGSWVTDPANGWTTADGNSAFQIMDPNAVDNNTVTIKLHYARPDGNYTNWNLWVWGDTVTAGQRDFSIENGEWVATVVADGRATQYISYIPRYSVSGNDWSSQEYGERRVYLGDVVSGTIHCYISSGAYDTTMAYGTDVVKENKITSVEYNYDTEKITVSTSAMVSVDPKDAFKIVDTTGKDTSIAIKSIVETGSNYVLTLNKSVSLANLYRYKINFLDQNAFTEYNYDVRTTSVYASERFGNEFTYTGTDLGATWTASKTTFRVWAPTAESVSVKLYRSGTDGTNDLIKTVAMTKSTNGTWVATVSGNQNGVYYTYAVNRNGETVEACDPYARTTGVNGIRAMVINLDATDPDGWASDTNPNPSVNYTDAIIY
jgi:pullulanase